MAVKSGIDSQYFRVLDLRHDVLVEADVAAVTDIVASHPATFGETSFRVERDVPAGADSAQESLVRVYRLVDKSWTQVFCPLDASKPFELGRILSERLASRSLQIEVTDDAWGGHVLFDRGALQEISCFCVGDDLRHLLPRLGLAAPELEEDERYEETEFFHSELALGRGADKLKGLVSHLGLWVDSGRPVWDSTREIQQLDLLFPA